MMRMPLGAGAVAALACASALASSSAMVNRSAAGAAAAATTARAEGAPPCGSEASPAFCCSAFCGSACVCLNPVIVYGLTQALMEAMSPGLYPTLAEAQAHLDANRAEVRGTTTPAGHTPSQTLAHLRSSSLRLYCLRLPSRAGASSLTFARPRPPSLTSAHLRSPPPTFDR